MDSKELLAYRKQIINDAVRMERKPDRTLHFANYWTWIILDGGYKISEALHDWDIMEKCVVEFQRKYNFDLLLNDGVRNPVSIVEPIGQSAYEIDDEKEIMNIRDISYMKEDEYDALLENFNKFLWETVMPRKYNRFNSELTVKQFGEVVNRYNACLQYIQRVGARLRGEYGVPDGLMTTPMVQCGFEQMFNFLRGIKGVSYDMRKNPDKLKATCELLDEMALSPALSQLEKGTTGDSTYAFDLVFAMLGHTILNIKQWERFYWPSLKKVLDAVVAADKTLYIFAEGISGRFWEYFKDYPKGHIAIHIEQDDVFEFKKALPNCCVAGGMPASLLGGGTKEQCVSYAKHLIDELGAEGFILSQDKMISYRNDTNPENLKAVCDFVREYR
ncbi:MAG: uroporphyrinogen decarboxylase family protein [Clostridiales bacterium]|nr:hypothetical protein [Eubacteriales bacterium]MDH7566070.1 uroporphyrinogen decarboxylase family protein [Clostridiales bacterium]